MVPSLFSLWLNIFLFSGSGTRLTMWCRQQKTGPSLSQLTCSSHQTRHKWHKYAVNQSVSQSVSHQINQYCWWGLNETKDSNKLLIINAIPVWCQYIFVARASVPRTRWWRARPVTRGTTGVRRADTSSWATAAWQVRVVTNSDNYMDVNLQTSHK